MKWEIAILIKEFRWKMIDQFYIPIMKLHKYVTVWRVIEMKVQLQWSLFFKMINRQQQKKQNVYLIHTNEADVSSLCTHMRFFDAQIFFICNFMQFYAIFGVLYLHFSVNIWASKKNINACHKPVHYLTIGKNSENVKLCIRGKP